MNITFMKDIIDENTDIFRCYLSSVTFGLYIKTLEQDLVLYTNYSNFSLFFVIILIELCPEAYNFFN